MLLITTIDVNIVCVVHQIHKVFNLTELFLPFVQCNKKMLVNYPNIWGFTRELYQHPAIKPTVNRTHIDHHYYVSEEIIYRMCLQAMLSTNDS